MLYLGLSSALLNPALTFAPVLVGGLVGASGFSTGSALIIISVELIATALAFLPALWWVAKISWRKVTLISLLAVTLGNAMSGLCDTLLSLMLLRMLTGVFEGTLLILYLLVIAQVNKTERMFGGKLAIQMAVAVLGLILIPYIIRLWGMPSVYFGMACITVLLIFGVNLIPNRLQQNSSSDQPSKIKFAGFVCLLLLFILAAGINMVWTYLERIGASNGLSLDAIGLILAAGVLVAIICALLCAFIGKLFGRLVPMCFALCAGVLGCLLLLEDANSKYFGVGVFMIAIARVIPIPYLFGCLAVLDHDKRLTIFSHVVLSLGMAMGPLLAILAIREIDYDQILWISASVFSVTLLAVFKLTSIVSRIESDTG